MEELEPRWLLSVGPPNSPLLPAFASPPSVVANFFEGGGPPGIAGITQAPPMRLIDEPPAWFTGPTDATAIRVVDDGQAIDSAIEADSSLVNIAPGQPDSAAVAFLAPGSGSAEATAFAQAAAIGLIDEPPAPFTGPRAVLAPDVKDDVETVDSPTGAAPMLSSAAMQAAGASVMAGPARRSGVLDPNAPAEVYEIRTDPTSATLRWDLTLSGPAGMARGQVRLFDGSGHILANWRFTGHIGWMMTPGTDPLTGSVFFVEISTSAPPGLSATTGFLMVATRTGPMVGSAGGATPLSIASTGATGASQQWMIAMSSPLQGALPLSATGAMAIGPLPSRSSAAAGGGREPGGLTPPIDRFAAATIDLDLIDPSASAAEGPGDWAGATGAIAGGPAALASLRGPGGFPLLGSALATDRRPEGSGPSIALPLFATPIDGGLASRSGRDPDERRLVEACHPPAAIDPRRPRRAGPTLFGLNLAAILVLTPLLPDLVAARLVPPLRRLKARKGR